MTRCRLLICAILIGVSSLATAGRADAGMFDDDQAIEHAVGAIKEKIGGGPLRVLKVLIDPEQVAIQAQDPQNPRHVDEFRFRRWKWGMWRCEGVGGPDPVQLDLINKDLDANLFALDVVQFAASPKLVSAALERAALDDPAQVTGMVIERQTYIVPAPSSGPIRWRVNIGSGRETAQIIADARGAIVGQDFGGTNRARNFDMLRQLEWAADAARDFRSALGTDRILLKVAITSSGVAFETNLPAEFSVLTPTSSLRSDKSFTWNLSGLRQALAGPTHVNIPGVREPDPPFAVDEVDWAVLPTLAAAARRVGDAAGPDQRH